MNISFIQLNNPTSEQISELQNIIFDMPNFYLQCEGRLPNIDDANFLLNDLPPDCNMDQKYFFIIKDNNITIGCSEIIRGWPSPDCCLLSLLALGEQFHRRGLGTQSFHKLEQLVSQWTEIQKWTLLIVETNISAFPFWEHLGFIKTGEYLELPHFTSKLCYYGKPLCPTHSALPNSERFSGEGGWNPSI